MNTRNPEWDKYAALVKAQHEERLRRLSGYEELVAKVSAALYASDPMGINFEQNTDEYDPEAQTIVLRLIEASGEPDITMIVHEEFSRWFRRGSVGPPTKYEGVARDISHLWSDHLRHQDSAGQLD